MENENKLKAIYKALDHLRVANESVKEAKLLINSSRLIGTKFDLALDSIFNVASLLLKRSESILKKAK